MLNDGAREFSNCEGVEAQPEREAAVLIPLPSPVTREDLSRFPPPRLEEYIPFIPLTSPVISPLLRRAPPIPSPHPQSLHEGETLFVKALVSLVPSYPIPQYLT